ncbi:ABC transporter permease [Ekhidna sp.]|uniref:ABC transporter permease n=1 Tax=Ekhidna sp. TaxID=2608089 RepID=UPI003297BF30
MSIFFNLSLRNFLKSVGLNSLNILGLSLGIIAALLITAYADHEYHYDQFHQKAANIYRMEAKTNGEAWFSNLGVEHSRELMGGAYPEVKNRVLVNRAPKAFLTNGDTKFAETNIIQTNPGSDFFNFFDYELVEGNRENLLQEPNTIVLTKSTAEKYFGDSSPVGMVLTHDTIQYKVTGVIADLPTNTHLSFDIIYINSSLYERDHHHSQNYFELVNDVNITQLEEKIEAMDVALNDFHKLSEVKLLPVSDIYLESDAAFGAGGKGDPLQLKVFLIVGALILLISITNYVNLSLAIYLGKGRAVGIRKVFGESKTQIVLAFIYESLTTIILTIPIILIGFSFALPALNILLDVNLENKLLTSSVYILGTLGFLALISILTVLYPAVALSNTDVNSLLKSKSAMNITGGTKYRNGLIFLQFILLFTLGISGWFMNQQIRYLDNKDMGFDPVNVIKINNAYEIGEFANYELFKTKLLTYPQIGGVAFGPMMGDGMTPLAYKVEGVDETYENLLSYGVDIDYFEVMGMELTHGDFKRVLQSSEAGQIVSLVNHNFINRYGWQNDPLGKKITLRPGTENELNRKVSGVFKDFHFYTLKEKITPQIISLRTDPQFVNTNILIKSNTDNLEEVINIIEDQWYQIQPNVPMEYDLMDEAVKQMYAKERQTGQISISFSILAISLSVLGLVGFMIYIIGLKSKELTIRKVLGASLLRIIGVLNQDLWFIVFTAAILGSLFSYLVVSSWLEDYAYTIDMNPWVYPFALILAYVLIFVITATRSIKWSRTNPALNLNDE